MSLVNIVYRIIYGAASIVYLWPPCGTDADIISLILPCRFFYLLLSFPRLISAVADRMSAVLPHIVWPSANLGYRSKTFCTRLAEIQDAKYREKFAIWAPWHTFVGLYLRK